MYNITSGTTQSTKDAFATAETATALTRLASNATTAESVTKFLNAIFSITKEATPVRESRIRNANSCLVFSLSRIPNKLLQASWNRQKRNLPHV